MTSKRLLDVDPASRMKRIYHYDDQERAVHLEVVQDVQPWLERNQRLRNDEGYKRRGVKKSHLHVATLPNVVIERWLNEKRIPRTIYRGRAPRRSGRSFSTTVITST